MDKIGIAYFSGTGNTEIIAELLKEKLSADLFRVEDVLNEGKIADIQKYTTIGIGFPSYGFNPPNIISEFIRKLEKVEHKRVFLFLTCGGPCYLNDVASFGIKRILKKKGYEVIYEKVFCMPANVFLIYNDELVKRLYDSAVKKTGKMADDISRNIKKIRNDRFLPYLFRWLMVPADRISFKMVPFDFTVSRACNKCMQCIRLCPRKNISFRGRIRHGLRCEACCRCIYGCPQKAISWRLGNFAVLKNGYNIRERINKVKDIKVTSPLTGIYRTLKSYLNE